MARTLRDIAKQGDTPHFVPRREPLIPNPWIRFAIAASVYPTCVIAWLCMDGPGTVFGVARHMANSLLGIGIPAAQVVAGSAWVLSALATRDGGRSTLRARHWVLVPVCHVGAILMVWLAWIIHDLAKYPMH